MVYLSILVIESKRILVYIRGKKQDESGRLMRTDPSWGGAGPLQVSRPECAFGGLDDSWLVIDGINDVKRSVIQRLRPFSEIEVARPHNYLKGKIIAISNIR